jgi:alanine or glycine:cation symporter, AGCS family
MSLNECLQANSFLHVVIHVVIHAVIHTAILGFGCLTGISTLLARVSAAILPFVIWRRGDRQRYGEQVIKLFFRVWIPSLVVALLPTRLLAAQDSNLGLDAQIDAFMRPIADAVSSVILVSIPIGEAQAPLIVLWLIFGAVFFTFYFKGINITGMKHGIALVSGRFKKPGAEGEISAFRALTSAVSGTVGVGNIAGVAITISLGGPGAIFWIAVAGFLGMATKFTECVLGVKYRHIDENGVVSGGPMYYLQHGLADRNWPKLGRGLAVFYAASIVVACLGIGNMFQSNQAYVQFLQVAGPEGFWADKGWLFGAIIAGLAALTIIGGIKSIAAVTSKLVPFMIVTYCLGALAVIILRIDALPGALAMIWDGAFSAQGMAGGVFGAMFLGFQRAAFSNEAGLGSAAIAHSAVRTESAATEGYVGLLEPFIDTVVVTMLSALVLTMTIYTPAMSQSGMAGIELTSSAFESVLPWAPAPLSIIAVLFAFSTLIAWAYYGLKGWTFLFGEGRKREHTFKTIFCAFTIVGCAVELEAILALFDSLIYLMALPNILGLYILAPVVKQELESYRASLKA